MRRGATIVALALLTACSARLTGEGGAAPAVTHGTAVGEVSDTSAVLWARCNGSGTLHVRLGEGERDAAVAVDAGRDFTGRILLDHLMPDTVYPYRAWCSAAGVNDDGDAGAVSGRFATAPPPDLSRPLRIVWSGDLGGQNVCRDAARGYPIFSVITARNPDLFIALGDMIYGDDVCTATGRYGGNAQIPGPPAARDRAGYWAHWRYNRADPGQQAMLATVPMAAVWDDHEIRNDAGPADDSPPGEPTVHLLPPALDAFLDYQPMVPPADEPRRLYRSQRWGKYLEIFLLDTRQYRDANTALDEAGAGKTMLGPVQRRWLEEAVAASTATWKVIVASVPLSIPTGEAVRDGFASGDSADGLRARGRRALQRVARTRRPQFAVADDGRALRDRISLPPVRRRRDVGDARADHRAPQRRRVPDARARRHLPSAATLLLRPADGRQHPFLLGSGGLVQLRHDRGPPRRASRDQHRQRRGTDGVSNGAEAGEK